MTGSSASLQFAAIAVEPQREAPPLPAAVPAGDPTRRPRPVDPRPPDQGVTCQVVFWRGYRKARFYACIFDDAGEPLALAESPAFRSPGKDVPERTEASVAAHDGLTALLLADGWELVRKGPGWYQATFRR